MRWRSALVCPLTLLALESVGHAQADPQTAKPVLTRFPSLAGFEVLLKGGYGTSTSPARRLEMQPYGASLGGEIGVSWRRGFRIGAYIMYGLGRSVPQLYDPLIDPSFYTTSVSSSVSFGGSLGYDVRVYFLVLRYTLNIGATVMSWKLIDNKDDSVFDTYGVSPSSSFHLAPGLGLIWPIGAYECGISATYFVQVSDAIPPGLIGELFMGVRL